MAARSASQLVTGLLLVVLGIVLGMAAIKAPELLQPAPAPAPAKHEPMTHAHNLQGKRGFLQDVRFSGSLGSDGWKGAATYKNEHGNSLKLGSKISERGVEEIEASAGYKSHDWQWVPDMEVTATKVPGTPGVKYAATMSKKLHDEGLEPTLSAKLTNSGLNLGAAFSKAVQEGLDVAMDFTMPIRDLKKVDLLVDTETTIKVGKGKVVGKIGGKAGGGLKSLNYGASYDLGA